MTKGKILVTGGAGYIGSFIVRELKTEGYEPIIVDNFSSGHRKAVSDFKNYELELTSSSEQLDEIFKSEKIEGVIHMASYIQMGESFKNPGKYFKNNLNSAVEIFEAMVRNNCKNIIFSSSAGVYGNPKKLPILEDDPKNPENPYGETKLIIERFLSWYDKAYSIKSICIRYFNAAGAASDGTIGEDHPNESHIIPLIIKAALGGHEFNLFGDDYNTPDGSCIRDYVHVLDLARAHVLSLNSLLNGSDSDIFNAGIGNGYSNFEIIKEIEKVVGKFKWGVKPRRQGDADSLYASTEKIKTKLGWDPKYGLKEIIESAVKWHTSHPSGYSE